LLTDLKTLILVRHAKSSWENPGLSDFDRPLNNRGLRDAPFMAKLLNEKDIKPDLILTSPAKRAYETSKYFATALSYPVESIQKKELIYSSGPKDILKIINQTDDSYNCIMLFGHNPDLSTISNYLSNNNFESLPTCGVICIDFPIDSWATMDEESGKVRFFEFPKKYFKK
jgi:phosphohistidine phosphatase